VTSGLAKYLQDGGTIDFESDALPDFPEAVGFMIHGINGSMVIPIVALALLIVAFLAKFPGAVAWAAGVLALVAVQVTLGFMGHSLSMLAFLHGVNALLLFGTALMTGRRVDGLGHHSPVDDRRPVAAA